MASFSSLLLSQIFTVPSSEAEAKKAEFSATANLLTPRLCSAMCMTRMPLGLQTVVSRELRTGFVGKLLWIAASMAELMALLARLPRDESAYNISIDQSMAFLCARSLLRHSFSLIITID